MHAGLSCILVIVAGLLLGGDAHAVWTSKADMPGAGRHHPATFVLNGQGYVITGSAPGNTKDFYRYDPVADAWTVLPDFPGPARSYAYAGSYAGKGYLGFGSGVGRYRDLWQYDPVREQWTELASCPGAGRQHPAFVITDNGKIFVGAGNSAVNLRDWWEYDIATNVWTRKADIPGPPRHHPYHFNIGDDAYVCFGHGSSIYRDVYRWNQASDSWTTMTLFPGEARVAGTEFSYGGKGYALSGEGADHIQLDEGEFWEYTPGTDSWTRLESHPGSGRWAPGSFVIGDTVYMMGGLSTTGIRKDMWAFQMTDPTGVETVNPVTAGSFQVFPNPVVGGVLHVLDRELVLGTELVRLFDPTGREVTRLPGTSGSLRIPHHVASGQYFATFVTKEGKRVTKPITVLR